MLDRTESCQQNSNMKYLNIKVFQTHWVCHEQIDQAFVSDKLDKTLKDDQDENKMHCEVPSVINHGKWALGA